MVFRGDFANLGGQSGEFSDAREEDRDFEYSRDMTAATNIILEENICERPPLSRALWLLRPA